MDVRISFCFVDAVLNFAQKAVSDELLGFVSGNTTRLEVEQVFLRYFADGCGVRTLDVIGFNFQVRDGLSGGLVGKHENVFGEERIGLLGGFLDDNSTVDDEKNHKFQLRCDGILARVIQHEYDHLQGVEFTEKVADYSKLMNVQHYREQIRNSPSNLTASTITINEFKYLT